MYNVTIQAFLNATNLLVANKTFQLALKANATLCQGSAV